MFWPRARTRACEILREVVGGVAEGAFELRRGGAEDLVAEEGVGRGVGVGDGGAADPDEIDAAGDGGEQVGELEEGWGGEPEVAGAEGAGREDALAGGCGEEVCGVGGEVLDEVQALPVDAEEGDGGVGRKGLEEGAELVAEDWRVGEGEVIEDDDGFGDVGGEGRVAGEGVGRQRAGVGGIRGERVGWSCVGEGVVFGDGEDGLRFVVFGEGEVGGLEVADGVAAAVGDDYVEDYEAGGGADGGDGLRGLAWRDAAVRMRSTAATARMGLLLCGP